MTITTILGIFVASIQIIPGAAPKKHGRDGNDRLKQDQYDEAAAAYQEGLSSYQSSDQTDQIYHGLQNNLGLSLHRQENFEEAGQAFGEALAAAPNEDAVSLAAFNAGNNAFTTQQLERALEFYETALLSDPNNEDAKFNYEFVSRQLRDQQQNQEQDSDENQEQEENQNEEQEGEQENESDQNEQNPNQETDQNENSEESNQQQSQEEQQEQNSQEQNQPQSAPLTQEQAERILEALENEEEELLREIQKVEARPRRVAKDW